jgi:hypothetical protein
VNRTIHPSAATGLGATEAAALVVGDGSRTRTGIRGAPYALCMATIEQAIEVLTDPENSARTRNPRFRVVRDAKATAALREHGATAAEARDLLVQALSKVGGKSGEGPVSRGLRPGKRHFEPGRQQMLVPVERVRG